MERLQEFFDVHKIEKCTYTELSASDGNKRKKGLSRSFGIFAFRGSCSAFWLAQR